jgi:hypothetical protein
VPHVLGLHVADEDLVALVQVDDLHQEDLEAHHDVLGAVVDRPAELDLVVVEQVADQGLLVVELEAPGRQLHGLRRPGRSAVAARQHCGAQH